jgi:diguanylate cyclase
MPQPFGAICARIKLFPLPSLTLFMTAPDRPVPFQRIRRWLRRDAPSAASTPVHWQEQLFRDLGTFLFDNALDPTPDNYDLAFQFRAAQDKALVAAVLTEIRDQGSLSIDAADRIFAEHAGPVSADALSQLAAAFKVQVDGLSSIARTSGDDVAAFRTALESHPGDVAKVVDLTCAMIARTRNAEAELRKSTRELAGLRAHLAEAQHFADVDPLTELANRRAFKRDLERAIVDCRAASVPLSLAFCDIDHFKRLNDLHGHETGDRVLRFVAQLMAKHFAGTGTVGRFGGEEFVVMFPGLDPETARSTVDKCRAALADLPLYAATTGDRIGAVSFTAGVVLLHDGEGMAELLRRADETLYRGKAEGRNRVLAG